MRVKHNIGANCYSFTKYSQYKVITLVCLQSARQVACSDHQLAQHCPVLLARRILPL